MQRYDYETSHDADTDPVFRIFDREKGVNVTIAWSLNRYDAELIVAALNTAIKPSNPLVGAFIDWPLVETDRDEWRRWGGIMKSEG